MIRVSQDLRPNKVAETARNMAVGDRVSVGYKH